MYLSRLKSLRKIFINFFFKSLISYVAGVYTEYCWLSHMVRLSVMYRFFGFLPVANFGGRRNRVHKSYSTSTYPLHFQDSYGAPLDNARQLKSVCRSKSRQIIRLDRTCLQISSKGWKPLKKNCWPSDLTGLSLELTIQFWKNKYMLQKHKQLTNWNGDRTSRS